MNSNGIIFALLIKTSSVVDDELLMVVNEFH